MDTIIQGIKQRFGIIGNHFSLNRAIEKAIQVAEADISVLVLGESGVGKENIPKIIHQKSHRKHAPYIAINCGAIPEGTIDSELFGHEKGAFTGATTTRKGYFEVANGGTVFLDEVGELPLPTQVRLLRVLETGEFLKVGSSEVQKTDVRIIGATNLNMQEAIEKQKFREDLYYRLSTIEIVLTPLRERKEDIPLLFRKFATDFAQKYKMPTVRLDENAEYLLTEYHWKGNIRQLKNVAEQISILEKERLLTGENIKPYLVDYKRQLPALVSKTDNSKSDFSTEREILYKILFDMKNDLNDLKKLTLKLIYDENSGKEEWNDEKQMLLERIYDKEELTNNDTPKIISPTNESVIEKQETNEEKISTNVFDYAETITKEESLSLEKKELELIKEALKRSRGKRKIAAKELGISERTLYRKIKQYNLNEDE